jgi:hypothetical protein
MRVYVAGDSIAYGLATHLLPTLNGLGYVTRSRCVAGQGLLDLPLHSVRDTVENDITRFDPDVVLLSWRGNRGTATVPLDSTEWYSLWTQEQRSLSEFVTARNAKLIWMVGPSMQTLKSTPPGPADDNLNDRLTRTIATNTRSLVRASFPRGTVVSAYSAVPDPWGMNDPATGRAVRTWDGLHLTDYGYSLLAKTILRQIQPVLRDP